MHRVSAVVDQRLREVWVNVVLRDAAEVVEIVLGRVLAEVRARDVGVAEVRYDPLDVLSAVMTMRKPPPVKLEFPPRFASGAASTSATLQPCSATASAAHREALPPPNNHHIERLNLDVHRCFPAAR